MFASIESQQSLGEQVFTGKELPSVETLVKRLEGFDTSELANLQEKISDSELSFEKKELLNDALIEVTSIRKNKLNQVLSQDEIN